MNLSRVVGPAVAGAMLAAWNPAAGLRAERGAAGAAFVLILRWKSEPRTSSALPGERFWGAMRTRAVNTPMQSRG